MEQIKAGFEDSLERGSISPILVQMMNPLAGLFNGDMPSDMPDIPEGMEDVFGDLFSMMMNEEENDRIELNENPKFPLGTFVKVKHPVKSPIDDKTSMKNWQGWIDFACIEEGKPVYTINLDIPTMEKMSKSLIQEALDDNFDFQQVDLFEHQIEKVKEKGKGNLNKAIAFAENLRIDVQWEAAVDGEYLTLIKQILKANLNANDETNWTNYLKSLMPFKATGMGKFELKKGKKVIIKDIHHLNVNIGFTVLIQEEKGKKRPYEYPLDDLMPINKKLLPVFELHNIWFHYFSEDRDDDFF